MTGHRGTIGAIFSRLATANGHRVAGATHGPARVEGLPTPRPAACPHCGGTASTGFYERPAVPDGDLLLVNDWHAGLEVPARPFRLHWCHDCGLVFNPAWEAVRAVRAPFISRRTAQG